MARSRLSTLAPMRSLFPVVASVLAAWPLSAQTNKKTLAPTPAPAMPLEQPAAFAGLKYRLVGPFEGGRVSRATGIAGDPSTYYFASASGGVWKSADGGIRWSSLTDNLPIASMGSIAVAPSDP